MTLKEKAFVNIMGIDTGNHHIVLFYGPVKDGTYYGITCGIQAGCVQFLSGAYLQNYTSYGFEISWVVITWAKTCVSCDNLPFFFFRMISA